MVWICLSCSPKASLCVMSLAWKNVSVFLQPVLVAFVAPAVAKESAGVTE